MSKWAVFSGGGSRGAFELGVISKLKELKPDLEYNGFAGTSAGALLAAIFSQGPLQDTIALNTNLWLNVTKGNSSIYNQKLLKWLIIDGAVIVTFLGSTLVSFFASAPMWLTSIFGACTLASLALPYLTLRIVKSVYDSAPLKSMVYKYFDPKKTILAGKKLLIGSVSWKYGTYEIADESNPDIHNWILASSAYPLFLDNVKIGELWYTDAGVRVMSPLREAIQAGATEVDVVLSGPLAMAQDNAMPDLYGQLMRTIEIMGNEILRNDLVDIGKLYPDVKINIFMPIQDLRNDLLSFDPKSIRYMFDEGQKAALKPITLQELNDSISRR